MRNIHYDPTTGLRLPPKAHLKRIRRIIDNELTQNQQEILLSFYFRGMTVTEIAKERGVHKSTVSRTLRRAEEQLRRYLQY